MSIGGNRLSGKMGFFCLSHFTPNSKRIHNSFLRSFARSFVCHFRTACVMEIFMFYYLFNLYKICFFSSTQIPSIAPRNANALSRYLNPARARFAFKLFAPFSIVLISEAFLPTLLSSSLRHWAHEKRENLKSFHSFIDEGEAGTQRCEW